MIKSKMPSQSIKPLTAKLATVQFAMHKRQNATQNAIEPGISTLINKHKQSQCGFTLLEVIVAMSIVGLVLGTTFGLLAGSKRLAFKAADDIGEVLFLRSAINAAQLEEKPDYPEFPKRQAEQLELNIESILEKPEAQTRPILMALEPYSWQNQEKGVVITTLRWKKLDTSQ